MHYPTTKKQDIVDSYFGHSVADPYRWLEDDRSQETAEWVNEQNHITFDFFEQIPFRSELRAAIAKGQDYEKSSQPFVRGEYTYFFQNDGLQNQSVLYRRLGDGEAELFLDPNTFSEDGTTSLSGLSFSKSNQLLAYSISEGGSDWRKIFVIDVATKQQLEPEIVDAKFTEIAWVGDEGFFYSRYDKPTGSELSARTEQHKLHYHRLGMPQSSDEVWFGEHSTQHHRYVFAATSADDRYVIVTGAESTSGNRLFLIDLQDSERTVKTLDDNVSTDIHFIDSDGEQLLFFTNDQAPNGKVVAYHVEQNAWREVIAEREQPLSISKGGGYLFATYMVDVLSTVVQYDYRGQVLRDISLPGQGTVSGLQGEREQSVLYYTFTNYVTPPTVYALDATTGESSLYLASKAPFDPSLYESKQVFYPSKDGTLVPMIISYKKGLVLDGSTPTILYAYGGFNISLTPTFSPNVASWLELGGIFAVANLRGGGEYGKAWHDAGTQLNKQNVFDDFIAAAEYLIAENYTSSQRLAIRGGSNGGLLVGACMTQRPDLYQVALPAVGVLDMLRYHTFTSGEGWKYDFGTSEQSEEMYHYLADYSPVHNVKEGVSYPATLVTTADHDDRVVPAHSYKFIAELQAKQSGDAPVMIRIDINAGHGAGMPLDKMIDLTTDVYAFTLYNMGIKTLADMRK